MCIQSTPYVPFFTHDVHFWEVTNEYVSHNTWSCIAYLRLNMLNLWNFLFWIDDTWACIRPYTIVCYDCISQKCMNFLIFWISFDDTITHQNFISIFRHPKHILTIKDARKTSNITSHNWTFIPNLYSSSNSILMAKQVTHHLMSYPRMTKIIILSWEFDKNIIVFNYKLKIHLKHAWLAKRERPTYLFFDEQANFHMAIVISDYCRLPLVTKTLLSLFMVWMV